MRVPIKLTDTSPYGFSALSIFVGANQLLLEDMSLLFQVTGTWISFMYVCFVALMAIGSGGYAHKILSLKNPTADATFKNFVEKNFFIIESKKMVLEQWTFILTIVFFVLVPMAITGSWFNALFLAVALGVVQTNLKIVMNRYLAFIIGVKQKHGIL